MMAQNNYKDLDRYMSIALIGTGCLFFFYLVFALFGVVWLKVILSILIFLLCAAMLVFLYLTEEIWKVRSRWMTISAICTAVCLLVSLITGCP